ncbi:hypothetical protein GQ457_06G042560 [Hibiscus cannabinus]
MTFLWIPPPFDEDLVLPASAVVLPWAFKRFRKEDTLEKVVISFVVFMVCLSSLKKDLPRIKTTGCLKYGSWMIRLVPMFEAGACLLLKLSPRSCLKLETYGFRSVFKFFFSDVWFLLLGYVQSLFHLCSSVVFVLEQWNMVVLFLYMDPIWICLAC